MGKVLPHREVRQVWWPTQEVETGEQTDKPWVQRELDSMSEWRDSRRLHLLSVLDHSMCLHICTHVHPHTCKTA